MDFFRNHTGQYLIVVHESTLMEEFDYTLTVTTSPGPPPSSDPNQPYLTIVPCRGSFILRWLTNAAGFQLQSSAAQLGPWIPIPPPYPVDTAHHYWGTSTGVDSARFYRLVRPSP